MKNFCVFFLVSFCHILFAQDKSKIDTRKSLIKTEQQKAQEKARKAPITSYKIISLQKDTVYVDTTLSIKKEYHYNYLQKDLFGTMAFPNEGQTYTTLDFGLKKSTVFPEFGYKGKEVNYLQVNDIKYYSVATPLTELYFKTVMEQGQSVDALVALNTSERFNFSFAFRGLRSLGKYINQLSSTGNFRFTSNYTSKSGNYTAKIHFTGQDLSNGENGGITTNDNFESDDPAYKNRARLQVYLTDAKSLLKGKRLFLDHAYRLNAKNSSNNLYLVNQLCYEHKFYNFYQPTQASSIGTTTTFNRFGKSLVTSLINDQNYYDQFYNKMGAVYENKTLGSFLFFAENLVYNYSFNSEKTIGTTVYPSQIKSTITTLGGQYEYRKKKWNGKFVYSNAISTVALRNLEANLTYKHDAKNSIAFYYQNSSKVPDNTYSLLQSSYVKYNWNTTLNNEKKNTISAKATSKWADASIQLTTLDDHLYFSNDTIGNTKQYISPKQYSGTINYISFTINKEIKYKKWALDNTFLYQKVSQKDSILNLPEYTLRSTLYFSSHVFKKAMFLQTGVILNYFSKYYADDYNPIIGDFFIQNNKKIGDFPLLDFFVNAQIRQARIYVKAEHFNAAFSANSFYATPSTPYHDFMIRFGLVWNMFQ